MTESDDNRIDRRVLILAPTGKDAEMTQAILTRAHISCACYRNLSETCDALNDGAGAVLLAEEAVISGDLKYLKAWLARQPPWSDLPLLVLARSGADSAAVAQAMELLGNVTVLERPIRVASLVTAVRTALVARDRQYETRDHLMQISRSERDLRDFFDNASIGLHCVDPNGIVLSVNQHELEMLGYSREEFVGQSIVNFHADRTEIEGILKRLSQGETLREYPAQMRRKDGAIRDVLINSNVLFDEGRFIHTRCFTRDVTDLNRSYESLNRLASIVESSDDAIISKTLDGRILTWNRGAERLFGFTADEAIGRPITILIPPERQHEEPALLDRLRRGERVEHFETVRVRKDGQRRDISLSVSPVRNAEGKIIAASKVARDVTERKRADEQLRQSEAEARRLLELHRTTVDNLGAGMYTVDSHGLLTYLNPEAERLLGWTSSELIGQRMHEAVHYKRPDGSAFPIEECSGFRVLHEGVILKDFEDFFIRKDGTFFPVSYSSSPLRNPQGEIVGLVVVFQDITTRKQNEQALRDADRRKDEFLAVLAHELRNPLAPIRNSLHILRLNKSHDATTEMVGEMMERQVNHMVRLVDDLLEVSRITRGKIELRKELVEVAAVVRSAVETSQPLLEAEGHQLALSLPPEPLMLEGDPVRLGQVFANLLNNSAKYTDRGGQIWLTVRRENDGVAISVRDNGTGIPPEMLPRIFDLFTQVDRHTGRAQGGLGIGLTLVKSLVELHGGTVEARSKGPGEGSEFIVHLPLVVEAHVSTHETRSSPAALLARRRVMVVDDNRDAAQSLGMLLQVLGANVKVVFSGPEALQAMSDFRPAVVLLDIGMPGMNGHEVARKIREDRKFDDVSLIALTGWGQEDDRRQSERAGFDHHLVKPADISALETLLVSLDEPPEQRKPH